MNKRLKLLTILSLSLPLGVTAQPQDDGPPPERERPTQRDREDRGRDERLGDRPRPGDRPADRQGERPGGEREDRPYPGQREPISVEQIDEALATLREMHGEDKMGWLQRIEESVKDNPEEAAKRLSRYPRLRELMDARKNRPEEFEQQVKQSQIMREVFSLVRKIREAQEQDDPQQISELKQQLRERFEALFEIRLALKEQEIERMRKHLKDAEQELAQIKADSDKLIDEKLNEILEKRSHGPRHPREEGDHREHDQRERPEPDNR